MMADVTISKGDWIVHANYGVGQVKGSDEKVLEGNKRKFLRIKTFNGDYWLPLKNVEAEHIRPVSSQYQFRRALTLIRKLPKPLPKDYKRRGKLVLEAAKELSIYSKARVLRDLYGRKKTAKLNQQEKDIFEKVRKQFLDEWSVVLEDEREVLGQKLDQALKKSYQKLEEGENQTWLEKVRKGVKEKRKQKNSS
jgi:RNA polymerase-interacting CarD/CdnL/TRCF family regulator